MAALEHGSRKFYDIPSDELSKVRHQYRTKGTEIVKELLRYVESNCIGKNVTFSGPYGHRKAIYCDYTASGRSLAFIEDYIREQVLPHYGNTHTTTNVTSLQSTLYRHEARDVIRNAVNASESDSVVFVGSGVTGAVHKLIHALDLKDPPTVFVGPFEHHSNLLPWKEQEAEVVWIEQDCNGLVDLVDLESKLKFYSSRRMNHLIGCFSAASNITGILTDVDAVTACLHRHGALALWDYATAGPYVEINMNPLVTNDDQGLVYKDAVFISTHKFVGGVSTPGILIAKKKLFINPVPSGCGGGSVFFVTHDTHRYLKEVEMREEAGTPAIVESIRAGLVFQLKQEIGSTAIMAREEELCRKALNSWRSRDNLILLGNTRVPRLPIFSFLVRHPQSGVFLHHNYLCALLNDLFGIQARGGCACAGPYAQDLLGINESLAKEIEDLLLEDSRLDRVHLRRYHEYSEREILRPGFVRLNLPYFMSDDAVDFVIKAIELIAQHGWKLLPQYMFNPETGEWRHRKNQVFRDRKWLGSISYSEGHMTYPPSPLIGEEPPSTYEECLNRAQEIFEWGSLNKLVNSVSDQRLLLGEEAERLRWFLFPSEASDLLSGKKVEYFPKTAPFIPPQWKEHNFVSTGTSLQGAEFVDHYQDSHGRTRGKWSLKKDLDSLGCSTKPSARPIEQGTSFPHSCPHCVLRSTSATLYGEKDDDRVIGVEKCDKCGEKDRFAYLRVDSETQTPTLITSLLGKNVSAVETESFKYNECSANICKNGKTPSDVQNTHECSGLEDMESCDGKSNNFCCDSNGQELNSVGERFVPEADNCRTLDAIQTEVVVDTKILSVDSSGIDVATEKLLALKGDGEIQTNGVTVENGQGLNASGGDESQPHVIATIPGYPNPGTLCKRKSGKNKKVEGASIGKPQFQNPPKSIFKATMQAIEEYEMIRDGDRVMVCLSGGKDSLSLLHTLHQYQFYAKSKGVKFDLGAATVDPQSSGYDPRPLIGYLAALEVPYFFEEQGIIQQAAQLPVCESICSFCSRMKRGRLYACARREGYNVLAMGQHLDDLAESFMMSVFHNGLLRTMKANYTVREGDLRVIRPFVYVRERDLRSFAEKVKLPVIAENCPACFEVPKERHRTKQLLAAQEILFPALYQSLLTAMKPLMARDRVGLESSRMKAGNYDEFL